MIYFIWYIRCTQAIVIIRSSDNHYYLIMKVLSLVVFACVAALALADGYGYSRPGFKRTYNGISARYNNAERQEAVNKKAEYIGRSSGTARWEGVPGTGNDFGYGYGYNDYNRGHGYDDGYRGYRNDGYRGRW